MNQKFSLFLFSALLCLAHPQQPQITAPPVPLTARAIEIHSIYPVYGVPIGVDTDILTESGSLTRQIYKNTKYLTEQTKTTTVDGKETATVVKPQVVAATATKAADGVNVGDITVVIAEAVQRQIRKIVQDACIACGLLVKRDTGSDSGSDTDSDPGSLWDGASQASDTDTRITDFSDDPEVQECIYEHIGGAVRDENALVLENQGELEALDVSLADDAPAALAAAAEGLTEEEVSKLALVVGSSAGAAGFIESVIPKFSLGEGKFGSPKGNGHNNDKPTSTQATSSSSTTKCDPKASLDANSPACDDSDCGGEWGLCKKQGSKYECPCAEWAELRGGEEIDKEFSDEQQNVLAEADHSLPKTLPPQCRKGTWGKNFAGEDKADPPSWCHCSSIGDGSVTSGDYTTMTDNGSGECGYSIMPTATIDVKITNVATDAPVTSCRVEALRDGESRCTCNNDRAYLTTVTVEDGETKTLCPTTAASTSTQEEEPTNSVECWPPGGSSEEKKLLQIEHFSDEDLEEACREGRSVDKDEPTIRKDFGRSGPARFPEGEKHEAFFTYYYFGFVRKDDSDMAAKCDPIYRGGQADEKSLAAVMQHLCVEPLKKIIEECPFTGGKYETECGTFRVQTCANIAICDVGKPIHAQGGWDLEPSGQQ